MILRADHGVTMNATAMENAIAMLRQTMGPTDPLDATPGSIRGGFATSVTRNLVHGSDSPESATREIALFFPEGG